MSADPILPPLLRLLQLADSGFPTGAFAYSHGLEGLLGAGAQQGEAEVAAMFRAHIEESPTGVEAPALCHAHRFAAAGGHGALVGLDYELTALKPAPAFRAASRRVGRRFLESAAGLVDGPAPSAYRPAVTEGRAAGHQAVAFGVVPHAVGLEEETAALAFGAGFVGGLAAVHRLGVVGQGAARRIVAALHPDLLAAVERARRTPIDEMGAYLPLCWSSTRPTSPPSSAPPWR